MVTGYEAGFYRDVDHIVRNTERIACALEQIANALTEPEPEPPPVLPGVTEAGS
jgi:hypothetical protein